jgi:hypothetical protein
MSFKPIKDRGSKRTSLTIDRFAGSHYGVGKTDQWKGYGYVTDFNFFEDKMSLRHGAIKNDDSGESESMESIFNVLIGGESRIAVFHGGVMDVQDVNTSFTDDPITWAQAEAGRKWDDGNVWEA